jgi:2-oxoisovalerate dehydrogenase E1 component
MLATAGTHADRFEWIATSFQQMALIREFEARVSELFRANQLPGFIHLSIGQEAVAVGLCRALERTDWIASTHRGHGHCIAKGVPLKPMMAELFGRSTGTAGGVSGSMHIADLNYGVLGANGIVGASLPIATGAALAEQLRGSGRVAVACFGDGAVSTGAFHESLNLAAVWTLPVVFLCENNGVAEFSHFRQYSPTKSVSERAPAYGMPAEQVDGNDVEAVFAACSRAVARAREGHGPSLVEAHTFRVHGHYEGDPMKYRAATDIAPSDPLERCATTLEGLGLPHVEIEKMRRAAAEAVDDAVSFARESPEPDVSNYLRYVTEVSAPPMPLRPEPDAAGPEVRYMDAIAEALAEEMDLDESVFLMGVDVLTQGGVYGVTRPLGRFGPERLRETPISEAAVMGSAVGAALAGSRPVVEIMFMDFLTTCFDQLVNQAAKMRFMSGGRSRLPLVVRTQMGAGTSAGPQHSQSLEALLAHIPGLQVVMPSTPRDAKGLLKAAIRSDGPVIFVENRQLYARRGTLGPRGELLPLGQARVVAPGEDVTIVAWSQMVHVAVEARDHLKLQGVEAEVVDLRTIKPLDMQSVLTSIAKTSRLVIAHEAVTEFGVGAEVAARAQLEGFGLLDAPVVRVGAPSAPTPFAPSLEAAYLPSSADIEAAVRYVMAI